MGADVGASVGEMVCAGERLGFVGWADAVGEEVSVGFGVGELIDVGVGVAVGCSVSRVNV